MIFESLRSFLGSKLGVFAWILVLIVVAFGQLEADFGSLEERLAELRWLLDGSWLPADGVAAACWLYGRA